MAADFYRSTHGNYWLVDRKTLAAARSLDLKYATPQEIAWIGIWSANAIHKLAKRLNLRQQVTATAIMYLRRFYLKNSYCETDVPLVAAACVYVAAKAEETAMHIKVVVTEARATFNEYGINTFPSDSTKLAEMEFYLIEDLEFHLIVYHPYRSLVHMTGRDSGPVAVRETMLDMDDNSLQMAWFVLNDTYRADLCLLYPPHLIAIASIYLAFSLHMPQSVFGIPQTSSAASAAPTQPEEKPAPVNSLHPNLPPRPGGPNVVAPTNGNGANASTTPVRGKTDPITFLASLNVQLPIVLEIVQEIISLYTLWKHYEEIPSSTASGSNGGSPSHSNSGRSPSALDIITGSLGGSGGSSGATVTQAATNLKRSLGATSPMTTSQMMGSLAASNAPGAGDERVIQILRRMRANRETDLASAGTGK